MDTLDVLGLAKQQVPDQLCVFFLQFLFLSFFFSFFLSFFLSSFLSFFYSVPLFSRILTLVFLRNYFAGMNYDSYQGKLVPLTLSLLGKVIPLFFILSLSL